MKKIVGFCLALFLTVLILPTLTFQTSAGTAGGMLGDVNGDYKVDAKDLTTLAKHVAKISTITDAGPFKAADVNSDGEVNAKDLTHLAKYVAKIIASLDVTGDFPDMLAQNVKIITDADLSFYTLEQDIQLKKLFYALDFSGVGSDYQLNGYPAIRYYKYSDTFTGDYRALQCLTWFGSLEIWGWSEYPVKQPVVRWEPFTDPKEQYPYHLEFGEKDFSWVARNILNADLSACRNLKAAVEDMEDRYYHDGSFYQLKGGIGWGYTDFSIQEAFYYGDYIYIHANIQNYINIEDGYAVFKIKEIDGKRYWSLYSYSEDGYIEL